MKTRNGILLSSGLALLVVSGCNKNNSSSSGPAANFSVPSASEVAILYRQE